MSSGRLQGEGWCEEIPGGGQELVPHIIHTVLHLSAESARGARGWGGTPPQAQGARGAAPSGSVGYGRLPTYNTIVNKSSLSKDCRYLIRQTTTSYINIRQLRHTIIQSFRQATR